MTLDPKATKLVRVLRYDNQLLCCRYASDNRLFASGFDGQLHRWTLDTKAEKPEDRHDTFPGHRGWVESMALHPDGKRLYTADTWGSIRCWSIDGPKPTTSWTRDKAHSTWLRHLVVSSDGKYLATCGNDKRVCVFIADNGKPTHVLEGHHHPVYSVVFHPDGKHLTSGDLFGIVKQWDIATGKCIRSMETAKLYKKYHQYDQGGVRSMTFDTAGNKLYCAGFEGTNANQAHGHPTVVVFDWDTGKVERTLTTRNDFKGPIVDVLYHPAGYLIGAGSSEAGGVLWFWKTGADKEMHAVKHVNSFRGMALHPDGKRLAAAAFGDRGGQRGGNGRRLDKEGNYPGFEGNLVLYSLEAEN